MSSPRSSATHSFQGVSLSYSANPDGGGVNSLSGRRQKALPPPTPPPWAFDIADKVWLEWWRSLLRTARSHFVEAWPASAGPVVHVYIDSYQSVRGACQAVVEVNAGAVLGRAVRHGDR